jgi:hypothetical protein
MKQRGGVRELKEVDEKLDNYYFFSDTISVIESSMAKGAGFTARVPIV